MGALYLLGDEMSNPIEEHINLYQHFAPNPTAFRESLEKAISYAKSSNKHLNMDLRDYFAAKAMHYWLCNPINNQQIENLCKGAYQVADAMMKAREQ